MPATASRRLLLLSTPPYTPVVQSVIVTPNPFSIPDDGAQQQTATSYDQRGRIVPSDTHTWGSNDTDVATVDSDGLVSGVAEGSVVITATSVLNNTQSGTSSGTVTAASNYDTISYNATTGEGIGGSTGAPDKWDVANRWANDAAFRANIASTVSTLSNPALAGTGNSGSLYNDGRYCDLIGWQNSVQFGGQPTYDLTIFAEDLPEESPTPELFASGAGQGWQSGWLWVRRRYPAGFEFNGDATGAAATWNALQGAGMKIGPYAGYAGGRGGLQTGGGAFDGVNYFQGSPQGGGVIDEILASYGTEFSDDEWRDWLVYLEQYVDGTDRYFAITVWNRIIGSGNFVMLGDRHAGLIGDAGTYGPYDFGNVTWFSLNYNRSRSTDLNYYVWGGAMWDAAVATDPFGVLTPPSTPTLTSATPNNATQGNTNVDITLVGTNFESGDDAIFSNSGITVNSTTFVDDTELTANIDVDPAATTGAGTVLVRSATNGDSNTQVFTVNSSGGGGTMNARDYSGSAQYLAKVNPTGVEANAAWTIGAWVYANSYGGSGSGIIKIGPQGGLARGVQLQVKSDGVLRLRSSVGDFSDGSTPIGTGSWVRVGSTKAGGGISGIAVILNGVQDGSIVMDVPGEITSGDIFGLADQNSATGVGYWDGQIAWGFYLFDEVLSASALDGYLQDPQSLVDDYGPSGAITPNALKVFWTQQCDDGTTEIDDSGTGNDGTYTGGATFSSGTGPSPSTPWDPCS